MFIGLCFCSILFLVFILLLTRIRCEKFPSQGGQCTANFLNRRNYNIRQMEYDKEYMDNKK